MSYDLRSSRVNTVIVGAQGLECTVYAYLKSSNSTVRLRHLHTDASYSSVSSKRAKLNYTFKAIILQLRSLIARQSCLRSSRLQRLSTQSLRNEMPSLRTRKASDLHSATSASQREVRGSEGRPRGALQMQNEECTLEWRTVLVLLLSVECRVYEYVEDWRAKALIIQIRHKAVRIAQIRSSAGQHIASARIAASLLLLTLQSTRLDSTRQRWRDECETRAIRASGISV